MAVEQLVVAHVHSFPAVRGNVLHAAKFGRLLAVEQLVVAHVHNSPAVCGGVLQAAKYGCLSAVEQLIKAQADVHITDYRGWSVLHRKSFPSFIPGCFLSFISQLGALQEKHVSRRLFDQSILSSGTISLNMLLLITNFCLSCLSDAAYNGWLEISRVLIAEAGAPIDQVSRHIVFDMVAKGLYTVSFCQGNTQWRNSAAFCCKPGPNGRVKAAAAQ
eukprot:318395-Pelagomonas_calceolata.AAC.10